MRLSLLLHQRDPTRQIVLQGGVHLILFGTFLFFALSP